MPEFTVPPEAEAYEAAKFISEWKARGARDLANTVNYTHERLWASSDPQAVLDLFGANAASLFLHHAQAVEFILGVDETLIPLAHRGVPPEWLVTPNQDGTVTVTLR